MLKRRDLVLSVIGVLILSGVLALFTFWYFNSKIDDATRRKDGEIAALRAQIIATGAQPVVSAPSNTGTSGTNGLPGVAGANGLNGRDSIVPGQAGLNGINGTDGINGRDSIVPGPAGSNGTNGTNGAIGPPGPYPASFAFTYQDSLNVSHTVTCANPDVNGHYDCSST